MKTHPARRIPRKESEVRSLGTRHRVTARDTLVRFFSVLDFSAGAILGFMSLLFFMMQLPPLSGVPELFGQRRRPMGSWTHPEHVRSFDGATSIMTTLALRASLCREWGAGVSFVARRLSLRSKPDFS